MAFDPDKVRQIAERVAGLSGLEVVEVEVCGAGKHRTLRVFIDWPGAVPGANRPDGVTHEDCANFSREFGTIIDVEDALPGGSYVLEVSSPGLDRKLTKDYAARRWNCSTARAGTGWTARPGPGRPYDLDVDHGARRQPGDRPPAGTRGLQGTSVD